MKNTFLLFFSFFSIISFSQQIVEQAKLDSIIKEANLLYGYEKAAWHSTDIFLKNKELKKSFGGYLIYHSNDSIYATYFDKTQKKRIAKYSFTSTNLEAPVQSDYEVEDLSEYEKELLKMKLDILDEISDRKYEIGIPEGFNPNFVLLKDGDEYRFYILMGTTEPNIIPFGNDYVFRANLKGDIKSWKKFHSRIIPAQTNMPKGGKVVSLSHSHLKTTPYISATDICTFRLYADFFGLKEFSVLSTGLGKYLKYNLDTNSIEVSEF